jgi:hypothetical protein
MPTPHSAVSGHGSMNPARCGLAYAKSLVYEVSAFM